MIRTDRIEMSEKKPRATPAPRNTVAAHEPTHRGMAIWAVVIGIVVISFSLAEVFPIIHAHQTHALPQEVRDAVVNILTLAIGGGFYLIVMGTIILCSPIQEEAETIRTKRRGLHQPGSKGSTTDT